MIYHIGTSKQLLQKLKHLKNYTLYANNIIITIPEDFINHSIRAVIALDGTKIAGVWEFNLAYAWGRKNNKLLSIVTLVDKKYRKQGLAKQLWKLGLKKYHPQLIIVNTISDKGYTLIKSLKESFPEIVWDTEETGYRKLRDLR